MSRIRVRAWWLRVTGRRWDHDLLTDAARRRKAELRQQARARSTWDPWRELSNQPRGNGGPR